MRYQGDRVKQAILPIAMLPIALVVLVVLLFAVSPFDSRVWSQTISSVRSYNGGVTPLFSLSGAGSLYIDNQGTQGLL